jgi:hypothetical protein
MAFYVMDADSAAGRRFAFFDGSPPGYDRLAWTTGLPMPAIPVEPMVITADNKKVAPPSDAVLSVLDLPIFSPRLRALLAACGASNIEYAPVRLVDPASGTTIDDFMAANVLGLVDCIDEQNSQIERSGRTGRIMSLEEFQLRPERVLPLAGMSAAPVIFRLRDFRSLVIASEALKAACEREKVTGLKFVPTGKFH